MLGIKANAGKSINSNILKWGFCIVIPLLVYAIPLNDTYTSPIRLFLVLSIFAIMTIAFDLFDAMVPAILLPIAYFLTGIAPAQVIFSPWSQTLVYVIIGAFLLAQVLDEVGLLKRIAYWCILRSGSNYKGVVWGVFFAGLVLGTITFGNAYVLMAALCYGICKALNLGKSMESAVITMVGCISAVSSRMFVYTPFSISLLENGGKSVDHGFHIGVLSYFFHNLPMFIYSVLVVFLLLLLYKPKQAINGKEHFQQQYDSLGKISSPEKKAAVILIILMVYLLTNSLHGLPLDYGFMLIPWLVFLPGIKIGSSQSIKNMNYSMIFFIVACLSIGTVSGALGIGKLVAQVAVPMLMPLGSSSVIMSTIFLGTVLNFLLTPLAILAAFSGPISQIANNLGMSLHAPLYALMYSTEMIVFPYEYVPQLIFFSFGMMKMGDFVKISLLKMTLCFMFAFIVMIPYWKLIGLL